MKIVFKSAIVALSILLSFNSMAELYCGIVDESHGGLFNLVNDGKFFVALNCESEIDDCACFRGEKGTFEHPYFGSIVLLQNCERVRDGGRRPDGSCNI